MKNKISAKIVADSISKKGHRITTMEVVFPRMILAEFNTHRLFTRNSASSRAIPFKKMVKSVQEEPFIPIAWQKDHSGMQGVEYFEGEIADRFAPNRWLKARDRAVEIAQFMNKNCEITKQLVNRLLEPFLYHKVLVTFTESSNFFNLRCPQYVDPFGEVFKSKKDYISNTDPDMQPKTELQWFKFNKGMGEIHIMDLAEKMWDAMNESTPKLLQAGQWHIPFGDDFNEVRILDYLKSIYDARKDGFWGDKEMEECKIKIATARCARLSYQTLGDNPKIDYEADLKLFDTLFSSGHLSPFEHVAKCMDDIEYETSIKGIATEYGFDGDKVINFSDSSKGWSNNFRGFVQYRAILENK